MDPPSEFVRNTLGDLAEEGLTGYGSTPARFAQPGFGVSYHELPETEEHVFSIAGEFGNAWYRTAFLGSYEEMDSLFRQVYVEWNFSLNTESLILGAGYGLPIGWIPGEELWTLHRYKVGGTFLFKGMYFSAMGWNYFSDSVQSMHFLLGIKVKPANSFSGFAQWDGTSALVGMSLNFKFMSLVSAYRFPGFSMGFSLIFHLGSWNFTGTAGNSSSSLDWFGVSAEKRMEKKTIL